MAIWGEKYLPDDIEGAFPDLRKEHYHVTGKPTEKYNCIAFAVGDKWKWWWPDPYGEYHWPKNAPREATVPAFLKMFGLFGYGECDDPNLAPKSEKIAIYYDPIGTSNTPAEMTTHAARQLVSGHWKSKLGPFHQIEHYTLECLNGIDPAYGEPIKFMDRNRKSWVVRLAREFLWIFWRSKIEQGTKF